MKRNQRTPWAGLIAGAALLGAAALAQAQYIWIDEKGLKQFSDRPPPPSVPAKSIVKAPGRSLQIEAPEAAPAEAATASAPKAAPTTAERNADFNKRKEKQAEEARKGAEEAKRQRELAANCEANRKHKALLESGVRVGTIEANGEQGFLSDASRASELAATRRALGACK